MGEKEHFQPLTKTDKITVVLYRIGILASTLLICAAAVIVFSGPGKSDYGYPSVPVTGMEVMLLALYFSIGLSVFFIHLYIGKFYRLIKRIYYLAVICLGILYYIGNGNPVVPVLRPPVNGALLLIPLSLCLGFVTAKEAFCFRLIEGYLLAIIMPAYLFLYSVGFLAGKNAAYGLAIVAVLLTVFMFRKVFMPVHYDIGDKSAYQP